MTDGTRILTIPAMIRSMPARWAASSAMPASLRSTSAGCSEQLPSALQQMLQLLQNLANGDLNLAPAPCQCPAAGHFLLASRASLISAGTGSMLLEFGLANWISKARQQPDKAVPSPPR